MIETLRIERLAVVDRVELEFGAGLNVLTGETGAGKSIVLSSLALLAGGRASAAAVREGAEEGVVEAVFRTDRLPDLEAELARRGLEPDGHELVVRRTVSRSGRSRAQVSGQLVPVALLAELFAGRIEVSSQHESQALLRPEAHGRMLDAAGGLGKERRAVADAHAALRGCQEELEALRAAATQRAQREDFLTFQVREIDEAKLTPGEGEALATERERLRHAERLGQGARGAAGLLAGDPAVSEAAGAVDLLGRAVHDLGALSAFDPQLAELAQRLTSAHAEVLDVSADVERYAETLEADPARLAQVEERLDRIERLSRKYGEDVPRILTYRDEAAAELGSLSGSDAHCAELEGRREKLREQLEKAASRLSAGRRKVAKRLGAEIESALHELSLPGARFEIALEALAPPTGLPCGAGGAELPEFRFCADSGGVPRSLRKVASGGELSRVFLALKNVMRRGQDGMVLVFDEVDAGVGGRVADRVGRVLGQLAEEHQVLCISHLPQIAALARNHFAVSKRSQGGRSEARVERLGEGERVEEIARMAGGAQVSEATRRHARELLAGRGRLADGPRKKATTAPV